MTLIKIILSVIIAFVLVYTISYGIWQWKTNKSAGCFVYLLSVIMILLLLFIVLTF